MLEATTLKNNKLIITSRCIKVDKLKLNCEVNNNGIIVNKA